MPYSQQRIDQHDRNIEAMRGATLEGTNRPESGQASDSIITRGGHTAVARSELMAKLNGQTIDFKYSVSGLIDRYLFEEGLRATTGTSKIRKFSVKVDEQTGEASYRYGVDYYTPTKVLEIGERVVACTGPFSELEPEVQRKRARNLAALALEETGDLLLERYRNDTRYEAVAYGLNEHLTDGIHPVVARVAPFRSTANGLDNVIPLPNIEDRQITAASMGAAAGS